MPNVLNEFAGDGVTRTFNFSMTGGYLSRDYVYFFIRPNDDLLNYTPYNDDDVTWITDFSVQTANPIPVGTTFVILRSTTLEPLVDFQNTSRITEKNLDTATWQSLHIAAETSDTVGRIQVVATNAKQESATAATLAQAAADDAAASADSAQQAGAAAASAQAASQVAQQEAIAAALAADQAVTTAAQAESTAIAANATAQAASAYADTATATANAATTAAANATTTANNASSVANSANATANNANAAATAAVGTANSAAASAAAAVVTANEAKDLVDQAVSEAVVSFNGRAGVVSPQAGDYTKAMVGLSNVDNTADLDKPLSTTMNNALGMKADKSYTDSQLATKANATAVSNALALKADRTYTDSQLALKVNTSALNKSAVGLGNVDNTADLDKPISNPTNAALGNKISGDWCSVAGFVGGGVTPYMRHASSGAVYALATLEGVAQQNFQSPVTSPTFRATGSASVFTASGTFDAGNSLRACRVLAHTGMDTKDIFALHTPGVSSSWRFDTGAANFYMYNNGTGSSAGGWTSTSDNRVKYNVRPIEDSLNKVLQLTGYTYIRQDMVDMNGNMPVKSGVLAQEVLKVLPSTVIVPANYNAEKNQGDLLSLHMDGLVGLLINAVKELHAEVQELRQLIK